ncbi:MAG TPA: serine hydrolase [Vicinamibacterales bacterium]|nr:serine hydrolase [Vicinamibacterales bacterium]
MTRATTALAAGGLALILAGTAGMLAIRGQSMGAAPVTVRFAAVTGTGGDDVFPGKSWAKVARPGEAGWSEDKLDDAFRFADRIGSGAILIVQHGVVVASWGDVGRTYDVFSVRKSLLHALLGTLVGSGELDLDRSLGDLGIDDKGGLSPSELQARVRDLLTSRSGVYHPAAYEARDNARSRPSRGSHRPGEFFYYNNWDFNVLGTIYERVAHGRIFDDFQARVAAPLGMEDFSVAETAYVREASSDHPAYVFRMTARDLARFGLLYLRHGRWRDLEIVPASWIESSTVSHVKDAQPFSDYGYLWWVYPRWSGHLYGASGKGNQKVLVWPGRDIVLVHLAKTKLWGLLGSEVGSVDFWNLMNRIAAAAPSDSSR